MIEEVNDKKDNPFYHRMEYVIDNKTVGYLEYDIMYEKMEIENIYVLENYRCMGIGSKLMEYLIKIANQNKIENITLEVRKSNNIAIKLYKKYGFNKIGIRHNYYENEDGILMEKKVM